MALLSEMRERGYHVIHTQPHVYCKVFEDNTGALELEEQISDIETKALPQNSFCKHCKAICGQ
jgi:hypothetical protein